MGVRTEQIPGGTRHRLALTPLESRHLALAETMLFSVEDQCKEIMAAAQKEAQRVVNAKHAVARDAHRVEIDYVLGSYHVDPEDYTGLRFDAKACEITWDVMSEEVPQLPSQSPAPETPTIEETLAGASKGIEDTLPEAPHVE